MKSARSAMTEIFRRIIKSYFALGAIYLFIRLVMGYLNFLRVIELVLFVRNLALRDSL